MSLNSTRVLVSIFKWSAYFLVALNIRSFPLSWHFRVFAPLYRLRFQLWWLQLKYIFKSRQEKERVLEHFWDARSPVGISPFKRTFTYKAWASLDECDFNMHLSNSCYAKILDGARFEATVSWFPQFLRAGGIKALAATHFHFIKEIPILATYEVRVSIGAWDEKWLYAICRFVTRPKPGQKKKARHLAEPKTSFNTVPISTPADELSVSVTPSGSENSSTDLRKLAAKLIPTEEPDGATLHAISISQSCFKMGRITVPPALAFASSGFCGPDVVNEAGSSCSASNPPLFWSKFKGVASKPHGGSLKAFHNLLKGGWKDVPVSERWWDGALGDEVEKQRKERLEILQQLKRGMEGARGLF